jgi:alcohol dehydrogenase, propanol-preferring
VVEDVPTPAPGPGQVLIRVEGAGFCHSDIHVIDGEVKILPRMAGWDSTASSSSSC